MTERKDIPQLRREISSKLKATLFLSYSQLATLLFGLGLFVIPSLVSLSLEELYPFPEKGEVVSATVEKVEQKTLPGDSMKTHIFVKEIRYAYSIDSRDFVGIGYVDAEQNSHLAPGSTITVEYNPTRYQQSRIPHSIEYYNNSDLILLIFPFLGLIVLIIGLIRTALLLRFFRTAFISEATFTGSEFERVHKSKRDAENPTLPNRIFTLEFQIYDGSTITAKVRRKHKTKISSPVTVFYHRKKPQRVRLLSDLPGKVTLTPSGDLAGSFPSLLMQLLLPIAFVAALIYTIYDTIQTLF